MNVPVSLRIALLAVATTAFYTYVGQLVPQKEVQPPAEVAISKDMTPEQMAQVGRQIMDGKGLCFTCHTMGKSGALRFPDLEGIGARAASRVPGLSDVDYLAQSLYEPDRYIVPGFNPGMPAIQKPPIGLTDDEILAVVAYLQSLGGKTTVTMETKLAGAGGAPAGGDAGAAPAEAPAATEAVPTVTETEVPTPVPGPGQSGPGQSGPGQSGPGQSGPGQSGPGQSGSGQ